MQAYRTNESCGSGKTNIRRGRFLFLEPLSQVNAFFIKEHGYHINDFLPYYGRDFVRNAYLAILGREPDSEGYRHYLENLNNGNLSKLELLGRLRYSQEGRQKAVKIRGLLFRYIIQICFRIPLAGALLRGLAGILQLPVIIKNFQNLDSYTHNQFSQLKDYLDRTTGLIQVHHNELTEHVESSLEHLMSEKADLSELQALTAEVRSLSKLGVEITALSNAIKNNLERIQEITASITSLQEQLHGKADWNIIQESLAQKADWNTIQESLAQKADWNTIQESLAQKADWNTVQEFLSQKVEHSAFQESLVRKADAVFVEQQLTGKAESTWVSKIEKSKADRSEFEKLLLKVNQFRQALVEQERRLWVFLEEAKHRLPEPFSEEQVRKLVQEEDHLLDAFYATFEDQFRGTRAEIKERLKVYLPYIKDVDAGRSDAPILDLGCGRGEWLELLKENRLNAFGVDHNKAMVRQCRDTGLEVIENDALTFLRLQKPNSLGAVTGHHFIEHLNLSDLVALLNETLRVLKPGGIIIFETPNPENLLVGAYTFYFDPTHRAPLPPETLKFIVEERGFFRTKILRLHKYADIFHIESDDDFLNKWFFSEMDFAIVGYKM